MQKLNFSKAETVIFINHGGLEFQCFTEDKQLMNKLERLPTSKLVAYNSHQATFMIPRHDFYKIFDREFEISL